MNLQNTKTSSIDWNLLQTNNLDGSSGNTSWKEFNIENTRIRIAEYSANYKTAEWCEKGHIIHCLEGEITLHFKNGNKVHLMKGNSVVIAEGDHHKATMEYLPAKLFVLD